MPLFPSSILSSFLRAAAKRRAGGSGAAAARSPKLANRAGMHWELELATGNSCTLATIGRRNVASCQCCQWPILPMANELAEKGAVKRRAGLESAGRNGAAFVKKIPEKEGAPLGNREDAAVPADVPVHDLDAPGDVRVVLSVDQRAEGLAPGVLGLDLDGDEPVAATEEEVHFERGVLPLPPSRVRALTKPKRISS